ncbi:MAG TPA: zf-HC2 domain-containing protein [Verrucomicrobiae bacterium]|nr:zf-HC2 domain-containing protein [Verrucomicrobiae bacterium]
MDCQKVQQLFDDLTHERLATATAAQVRQHLADCTDCRVMEQRTGRLQRLLALKRYERPAPGYFDNFLSEFHGRLLTEARQIGWWERVLGRVDDFLAAESMRVWRYSFTSALGVAAVVGLTWMGLRQASDPAVVAVDPTVTANSSLADADAMLPPPQSTPNTIVASLPGLSPVASADYQSSSMSGVVLVPTSARADSSAPRYVLDRISVTPASYDVPSVHF